MIAHKRIHAGKKFVLSFRLFKSFFKAMFTVAPIHTANTQHQRKINFPVMRKCIMGWDRIRVGFVVGVLWKSRIWCDMNAYILRRNRSNVPIVIMRVHEGINWRSILRDTMVKMLQRRCRTRLDRWEIAQIMLTATIQTTVIVIAMHDLIRLVDNWRFYVVNFKNLLLNICFTGCSS